jgi:hypothetical protein
MMASKLNPQKESNGNVQDILHKWIKNKIDLGGLVNVMPQ